MKVNKLTQLLENRTLDWYKNKIISVGIRLYLVLIEETAKHSFIEIDTDYLNVKKILKDYNTKPVLDFIKIYKSAFYDKNEIEVFEKEPTKIEKQKLRIEFKIMFEDTGSILIDFNAKGNLYYEGDTEDSLNLTSRGDENIAKDFYDGILHGKLKIHLNDILFVYNVIQGFNNFSQDIELPKTTKPKVDID